MINIDQESIDNLATIIDQVIDINAHGDLPEHFTKSLLFTLKKNQISKESAERVLASRFIHNPYLLDQVYDKKKIKDVYPISSLYKLNLHSTLTTMDDWVDIETQLDKILHTIQMEKSTDEIYPIDSNNYLVLDHQNKQVCEEIKNMRSKSDENIRKVIINAIPDNIHIHVNPFVPEEISRCDIDWYTKTEKTPLKMRGEPLSEIRNYLQDHLLVFNKNRVYDVLAWLIQTKKMMGHVKLDHKIDIPGIFVYPETGQILTQGIEVYDNATYDEEEEALDFLDHYAGYFTNQTDKLATVLKWGWMSPFIFMTKQLEYQWIPWLYLYGKAGSGKTEGYGYPILYMYGQPVDGVNNIGGAELETTPRIGKHASSGTLMVLVNEPGKIFQTPSTADILKNCITSKTSRGKYIEGVRYTTIPSYASMMFTSNRSLPADESLRRRFIILNCSHDENTISTKDEFMNDIKPNQADVTPLNKLKVISAIVLKRVKQNPELLSDWEEGIDGILNDIYTNHGREYGWLSQWRNPETIEDLDEEKRSIIREALAEKIIRTFDEEVQAPVGATPMSDVLDIVIDSHRIPWIDYKSKKSCRLQDHEIAFSSGLSRFLHSRYQENDTLKDIAGLLGWRYKKSVYCFNSNGIYTTRDELLSFLFPADIDYFYQERYPSGKDAELVQF